MKLYHISPAGLFYPMVEKSNGKLSYYRVFFMKNAMKLQGEHRCMYQGDQAISRRQEVSRGCEMGGRTYEHWEPGGI